MELTKQFSDDQYAAALESWSWLDLSGKTPRFASLFGNVFLEDDKGAWWFLDTFGGELVPGWASRADLTAELETEQGQDQYLLGVLAMAAFHRRGLSLGDDEVYAYTPPPSSPAVSTSTRSRCSGSPSPSTPLGSSTSGFAARTSAEHQHPYRPARDNRRRPGTQMSSTAASCSVSVAPRHVSVARSRTSHGWYSLP